MRATLALSLSLTFILAACKHDDGVGTTAVTSGTLDGPRVTNVAEDTQLPTEDRLAGAVCVRERECARDRGLNKKDALAMHEAACVIEVKPTAAILTQSLTCSPAEARAGVEECLAAIAREPCDTPTAFSSSLPACRAQQICGRGVR